jgi:hypothetical protein
MNIKYNIYQIKSIKHSIKINSQHLGFCKNGAKYPFVMKNSGNELRIFAQKVSKLCIKRIL